MPLRLLAGGECTDTGASVDQTQVVLYHLVLGLCFEVLYHLVRRYPDGQYPRRPPPPPRCLALAALSECFSECFASAFVRRSRSWSRRRRRGSSQVVSSRVVRLVGPRGGRATHRYILIDLFIRQPSLR